MDSVRGKVLSFFNTSSEEYSLVFTSGATSGTTVIMVIVWAICCELLGC
jgi:selenocysteine lyase/cysteine desulfurase